MTEIIIFFSLTLMQCLNNLLTRFCLSMMWKFNVTSEKYCHVQSDVTAPVHIDRIEQQCETSSPTDYFTTSCFPPARLHICLPPSRHQYCCCLSPPTKKHFRILITDWNEKERRQGSRSVWHSKDIKWCLCLCVAHVCLFMGPAILQLWSHIASTSNEYWQLIPCAGAVWVIVSQ